MLRKHGVRFGQFTIFLPALLKPAPTRLRLVLWSLHEGLSEFPESPPPGLVTIPHLPVVPDQVYALSGYRPAGDRAIRIDMLERLADLLRTQDTRGGFEANPDMLSITGMTLEQFSGLMQGLGYSADKAERSKVKTTEAPAVVSTPEADGSDAPMTEEESVLAAETRAKWEAEQAEKRKAEAPEAEPVEAEAEAEAPADISPPEMEVFYTFKWAPKPRGNRRPQGDRGQAERPQGDRPQGQRRGPRRDGAPREGQAKDAAPAGDRPRGDAPQGERRDRNGKPGGKFGGPKKSGKPSHQGPQTFSSRPEKKADPDSPFAILAQLKDKT